MVTLPARSSSNSTKSPRAAYCSSPKMSAMLWIGPHGTSPAPQRASTSDWGRDEVHPATTSLTSARCASRRAIGP